jgi:rod shape determining protein RodA
LDLNRSDASQLRRWRQFDIVLLFVALALVVYGVGVIHTATCSPSCSQVFPPSSWAVRQLIYGLAGVGLLLAVAMVDYRLFRVLAYPAFALTLLLLVLVLIIGHGDQDYGARRWISLGFFDFQPSEITKVTMTLALARWLGSEANEPPSLARVAGSLGFVLAPVGLIYLEPDLGTGIAYFVIWFGMLIAAGTRPLYLGGLLAGGLLAAPLGWLLLRDYMRQRILTFFAIVMDPESDIFGEGYNILQARISVGSGGLFGRGFLQGTQNQFDYLRIKHSDFIFSVLAEELGFLGSMALFALFILLLFRIVRAAERARDSFGRLVAFGIACMLLFQAVVNLGANLTVLPVTGVPLPLVSFGGSALLTNFIALGLVQSILVRRLKYRF